MNRIASVLLSAGLWLLSVLAPAQGAGIGVVAGLRGDATVRREQVAQAQRLKFKDDLFWQDTLSTGADAQLRLLILQKSVITMKELTQLQLREELVSPNQPRKKSVVELVSGAVRVAVDKDVLKDNDYEVRTNMAVAAIRGSDLYGRRISEDRVEYCSGPESNVTTIHRDPAVGRRELRNLQCAAVSPGGIEVRDITIDFYRTLTSIGPSGSQNPNSSASANAKISTALAAGDTGGIGGSRGGSNNPYTANNSGCLLCKTKKTESLGSPQ